MDGEELMATAGRELVPEACGANACSDAGVVVEVGGGGRLGAVLSASLLFCESAAESEALEAEALWSGLERSGWESTHRQ